MPKATRIENKYGPPPLTAREEKIVTLIFSGISGQELASVLGMHVRTLKCHMQKIFDKLGCSNVLEMVAMAYQQNAILLWTCEDVTYHPELYGPEEETPEKAAHRRRREILIKKYTM